MLIKDLPYGTSYSMMRLWLATSRRITAEETDVIGDLLIVWHHTLPGYNLLMQTLFRRHIALPQEHGPHEHRQRQEHARHPFIRAKIGRTQAGIAVNVGRDGAA